MTVSREAIEKWLGGRGRWEAFSLIKCGAYLKNGEIHLFYHFTGQGDDENVFNKTYDKIVYFTDDINAWLDEDIEKSDVADRIEEKLKELN